VRIKKLYVASPLGFSELGRIGYKHLLDTIAAEGYEVIDPWKLTDEKEINRVAGMPYGSEKKQEWQKLNSIIGQNNSLGIERADGVVAVLDGSDVDSGTASEVGYACALGKPILGYRGDFRLAADNEGSLVNLQVEYFVRKRGGLVVATLEELRKNLPVVFK